VNWDPERYERNIRMTEIGEDGQRKLSEARVAVVGLGGIGGSAAYYLAAAGVGTLGLVDPDKVERSNLQRQILHATDRIGSAKTESAAATLGALNPDIELVSMPLQLTSANAAEVLGDFDVVVEATDSYDSKYLVNDACLDAGKPLATAGAVGLSGHALFIVPGKTCCLRCALPCPPEGARPPAEQGVLGAVPGLLGSLEALEVLRWLVGAWEPPAEPAGSLHGLDGKSMTLRTIRVPQRDGCRCEHTGRPEH
jgi:adenylyltransferase/sulfurtransferase